MMIIESLSITNFRQFHGEETMELSTNKDRNVTVVHGSNGSGKTSLLNAFKWCFYGRTDFDTLNENILNEASIQDKKDGGHIELKISVKFLHEKNRYGATRSQKFKKISGIQVESIEDSQFILDVTGEDGETKRSLSPFVELQAILPQDLQPYFFFNGERIEHIAGINQSVQIQDAIRKLMGLEVVDRAIVHIDKAKNRYRRLVKQEVSKDQRDLIDLIELIEESMKNDQEKYNIAEREVGVASSRISSIERELKKYEESRSLQEKRDELEKQLENNEADLLRIKTSQKRLIDENGFLILSGSMIHHCEEIVEKNRKKGVLPYGIKSQFIDDRIEMGVCICCTKIEKDSKEHHCLLEAKLSAGSDEQESVYTGVSSLLKGYREITDRYKRDYAELAEQLSVVLINNDKYRIEINEISAQLSQLDDIKIASLEKEYTVQVQKRDIAIENKGISNNSIVTNQEKLHDLSEKLERLEDQKIKQNIANRRMIKAGDVSNILVLLRESLSNQVRVELSKRVDDIFQSIIRKPVRAIIDDQYRLQVLKETSSGEEYVVNEQSTGERQVTSLSFISSIISLAKEKYAKKALFFQGGLYPLVMDSPFGALDDDYREKVAASVSDLAEQVVIFVSNSQWSGKVKLACENKVGKSYQLIYHSPKIDAIEEDEYTVSSDNGFEYSTLKEVKL